MKRQIISLVLLVFASSANALNVTVTQMDFYPPSALGVPSFTDPDVRGDNTSSRPTLTPANIDIDTCSNIMYSGPSGFFSQQWTAVPTVCFTTAGDNSWDFTSVSGQGGGTYTWTMTPGQFAVGFLFTWSTSNDIPVLAVFDTDGKPVDTDGDGSPGTPMLVGPFPGQTPAFTGGQPSISCQDFFVSIATDTTAKVDINTDLLSTCINAQGATTLDFTQPAFGAVSSDGNTLTYTPVSAFQGPDSFTYTVSDSANSATATVNLQIGGELQGNFTMLDSDGNVFGGTNDVVFTWDGSSSNTDENDATFGLMTIQSAKPQEFFSFVWSAHHIRVFTTPGTYYFDTTCDVATLEATGCKGTPGDPTTLEMTVGAGQVGAHILFDWSSSTNIDVVNVWDKNAQWNRHGKTGNANKLFLGAAGVTPAEDANWELVSTDINGDNINSSPMVDGPFVGFYANFNNKPDKANTPPPPYTGTASATKLDSSILSLNFAFLFTSLLLMLGLRKFNQKK